MSRIGPLVNMSRGRGWPTGVGAQFTLMDVREEDQLVKKDGCRMGLPHGIAGIMT